MSYPSLALFSVQKQVLNVNDSNMGNYKYIINISGDNKVSGISVDSTTCSRLFGFLVEKQARIIPADLMFSLKTRRFGETVSV